MADSLADDGSYRDARNSHHHVCSECRSNGRDYEVVGEVPDDRDGIIKTNELDDKFSSETSSDPVQNDSSNPAPVLKQEEDPVPTLKDGNGTKNSLTFVEDNRTAFDIDDRCREGNSKENCDSPGKYISASSANACSSGSILSSNPPAEGDQGNRDGGPRENGDPRKYRKKESLPECFPKPMLPRVLRGRVKFFNVNKGYGFVITEVNIHELVKNPNYIENVSSGVDKNKSHRSSSGGSGPTTYSSNGPDKVHSIVNGPIDTNGLQMLGVDNVMGAIDYQFDTHVVGVPSGNAPTSIGTVKEQQHNGTAEEQEPNGTVNEHNSTLNGTTLTGTNELQEEGARNHQGPPGTLDRRGAQDQVTAVDNVHGNAQKDNTQEDNTQEDNVQDMQTPSVIDDGFELFIHVSSVSGRAPVVGDEISFQMMYDKRRKKFHALNVHGGTGSWLPRVMPPSVFPFQSFEGHYPRDYFDKILSRNSERQVRNAERQDSNSERQDRNPVTNRDRQGYGYNHKSDRQIKQWKPTGRDVPAYDDSSSSKAYDRNNDLSNDRNNDWSNDRNRDYQFDVRRYNDYGNRDDSSRYERLPARSSNGNSTGTVSYRTDSHQDRYRTDSYRGSAANDVWNERRVEYSDRKDQYSDRRAQYVPEYERHNGRKNGSDYDRNGADIVSNNGRGPYYRNGGRNDGASDNIDYRHDYRSGAAARSENLGSQYNDYLRSDPRNDSRKDSRNDARFSPRSKSNYDGRTPNYGGDERGISDHHADYERAKVNYEEAKSVYEGRVRPHSKYDGANSSHSGAKSSQDTPDHSNHGGTNFGVVNSSYRWDFRPCSGRENDIQDYRGRDNDIQNYRGPQGDARVFVRSTNNQDHDRKQNGNHDYRSKESYRGSESKHGYRP